LKERLWTKSELKVAKIVYMNRQSSYRVVSYFPVI